PVLLSRSRKTNGSRQNSGRKRAQASMHVEFLWLCVVARQRQLPVNCSTGGAPEFAVKSKGLRNTAPCGIRWRRGERTKHRVAPRRRSLPPIRYGLPANPGRFLRG